MRRDVFQAIADPTRREIIHLIARQVLTLNAVAESFHTSRQAISRHIKILTECGIVEMKQQGRERYCVIQPDSLDEVHDWLEGFRNQWESRFTQLDTVLADLKAAKKQQVSKGKATEALPGERTRVTIHSICRSVAQRDGMINAGMKPSLTIAYQQLDELLAHQ